MAVTHKSIKLRYICLFIVLLSACGGGSSAKNSSLDINSSAAYSVRTEGSGFSSQTFFYDDAVNRFIVDSQGVRGMTIIGGELVVEEEF